MPAYSRLFLGPASFVLLAAILLFLYEVPSLHILSLPSFKHSDVGTWSVSPFGDKRQVVDDDYTCNANKPCSNGACCGESGNCGYGPEYCGDGCQSNCDAHAQCGEFAAPAGKECPLNVCCSRHGFCGVTSEFCDEGCQSNCGQPLVPDGKSSSPVRQKVIGYYEAWSARRKCHSFNPSSIPVSGLTHLNFAFASIDPATYEIVPMDDATPRGLFQEVTALKDASLSGAGLEVFIALGGWTFSNDGTDTQPLFGEISADAGKRQQFADHLVDFMIKYGFDGVDIDWEYPGAPDRGGKKRDVKNFVLLMKTLRETFDANPGGGFGLTFTIPSSYWYLQHFDVPGLLEYADWTNLMSYDLHGVWDANNEIGNVIHGHTNLTEINLATDLLWRNNVPPGKVVLGTGFYGRSFELSDSGCTKPGCTFSGPAKAGECTGEGGILGFFEIQDILGADDSIQKIHDEEAAVNYFAFDNNQWVSYDDKKTFQQKVDWANNLGLGGLMTWAVDMDDSRFTALSGLLGKDVGSSLDIGNYGNLGVVIDNWASQNGQACQAYSCGESCPSDMTEIGRARDSCGDGLHRKICCPPDKAPSRCSWRGAEGSYFCNSECQRGESQVFESKYGAKVCLTGTEKFCCTSPDYENLVGSCQPGECGASECPSGKVKINTLSDGSCPRGSRRRPICCDDTGRLSRCAWTLCPRNECLFDQVLVMRAKYQDSLLCQGYPETSLCCDVKNDDFSFLPVDPELVFPEVPPSDYVYNPAEKVELYSTLLEKELTGDKESGWESPATFGLIMLAGPPSAVTSFDKREGSHMRFLSCDGVRGTEEQSTRVVCMLDGEESNCDNILLDGVDGTIVKMPESCGPGQYVVARSLEVAQNQSLPSHITQHEKRESTRPIMDLTFDYNFADIKRAEEPIYIRVDYSNVDGYWESIVEDPGVNSKRSSTGWIEPRFFSSNEDDWKAKFAELTADPDGLADTYSTDFSNLVDETLYADDEDCGTDDDQFLQLRVSGTALARAKWGFSLIGTLQPFNIDQAYSFIGGGFALGLEVSGTAYTGLSSPQIVKDLWSSPITASEFVQPGLLSFTPKFQVEVAMTADDVGMVGDFTANLYASTDGYLWTHYPQTVGGVRGNVLGFSDGAGGASGFDGNLKITEGSLSLTFQPKLGLDIVIDRGTSKETNEARDLIDATDSLVSYEMGLSAVLGLGANAYDVTMELSEGLSELLDHGLESIGDFGMYNDSQYTIGEPAGRLRIGSAASDIDAPSKPRFPGFPIFGAYDLQECFGGLDEDSAASKTVVCSRIPANASLIPPDDEPSIPGHELLGDPAGRIRLPGLEDRSQLEPRGNPRTFWVLDSNGNRLWNIRSLAYPSIGRLPFTPGDPLMDISDPDDCTDTGVTEDGDPNESYVTEHIFELQSVSEFLSFAIHGRRPDGTTTSLDSISSNILVRIRQDYRQWAGPNAPAGNPINDIFNAIGSDDNTKPLIACEAQLNSIKARVWAGISPISDTNWRQRNLDGPQNLDFALSWLREAGNVFAYLEAGPVQDRLQETVRNIRANLQLFEDTYNNNTSRQIRLVALWDEWVVAYFENMRNRAGVWARGRLSRLLSHWQHQEGVADRRQQQNPSTANQAILDAVRANVRTIRTLTRNLDLQIDETEFWDFLL